MRRNKKRPDSMPSFQIGTSYLLVIFVILCLVTFAALSLSSALKDQSYSQKLTAHQTEYNAASAQASALLAQIDEALEADAPEQALTALAGTVSDSEEASGSDTTERSDSVNDSAQKANNMIVISVQKAEDSDHVFEVDAQIPVSETQNLQLTVSADTQERTRKVTCWKETAASGWEEKTTLPVLGSDSSGNQDITGFTD
ncbi:hypothetical protein [uncultured Eubacterium sp.]|uniref:hypothetical protein n=1 Tax=uncultured Eubacterium sp. TaxID=165185 RepID=UPI0026015926|nr:hypothetical protein [uncultured Eubacterium sp.]MCI6536227.1 hypothetical protein [Lachnospiraceae bacterium]